MILKNFELYKKNLDNFNFFLLYGENQGFKDDIINFLSKNETNIFKYFEDEIINNKENFLNSIFTQSLFENKKTIIVNRVSGKILDIIKEVTMKNFDDVKFILEANILDKKSKLRDFFEKEKKMICIPFYQDNQQTLNTYASEILRKDNIILSNEIINFITSKAQGDRRFLKNEISKIKAYCKNKKKINMSQLGKLVNLSENHSINEIVDNCLAKDNKTINKLMNENLISNDDLILIIRVFLTKAKRILFLRKKYEDSKDLIEVINSSKPPIFWKDKEIVKTQIKIWSINKIKKLIYEINELELLVKKNINSNTYLLFDFIYKTCKN